MTSEVHIFSNSIEVASDIVQSLIGEHLNIKEAMAKAQFPHDFVKLEVCLDKIKESNQLKNHFAANIADSIQNLKVAVVKAEASLIIDDIQGMRKNYAIVQQENGTLVGEYIKRTNNHQDLVSNLKNLNNMIRFASNLRLGDHQKRVVAEARDCIKKQTLEHMRTIFERGYK